MCGGTRCVAATALASRQQRGANFLLLYTAAFGTFGGSYPAPTMNAHLGGRATYLLGRDMGPAGGRATYLPDPVVGSNVYLNY